MATLIPALMPSLAEIPWLRHAITTRDPSLPLGGDMSFSTGATCPAGIIANRTRWLATLGRTPEHAVMSGLIHGTDVRQVDWSDAGRGVTSPVTTISRTDGLITNEPGLTLMMCFADCVPLIAVDTEKRVIGLAHAGWRGTLAGMAGRLIEEMRQAYDSHPATLSVVIGPSIGPRVYAVGPEVVSAFSQTYPEDRLISESMPTRLDLWEANAAQFRRAGLADETVHTCGICTFEQADRFFSHRYAARHNEAEGRFAVLLSIEE